MRTTSAVLLFALVGACGGGPADETEIVAVSGVDLYTRNCASCHGLQGEGDGPVAAVMQETVPNLRTLSMRNDGEFPIDAVTAYVDGRDVPNAHGDRRMPVWGNVFGWDGELGEAEVRSRIDAIVAFVDELQYR
jgi:mono/diheme cytochrome c family protein